MGHQIVTRSQPNQLRGPAKIDGRVRCGDDDVPRLQQGDIASEAQSSTQSVEILGIDRARCTRLLNIRLAIHLKVDH
jgi:hypothetical protein